MRVVFYDLYRFLCLCVKHLNHVFELCQGYVAEFFMKKIMCMNGVVFQVIGENSI